MSEPADGERLRRAFQSLAGDGGEAVDDEAIWRAVTGEASLEEHRATLEEVARNPAAAESWRLAVELERQIGERVEQAPAAVVPVRRRLWQSLSAVAATVALVAGVNLWLEPTPEVTPVYRDPAAAKIISSISETEPLPRHDAVLRWSDLGAGSRYMVRLLTDSLIPLFTVEDLAVPEVRLPPDRLAELPADSRLLWQVEARLPDGRTITSPAFFLELSSGDASDDREVSPDHLPDDPDTWSETP